MLYGTKSKYLQKTGWNMFSSVWSSIAVIDGIRYGVNGAVPEDKGDPYTAWVHGPASRDYPDRVIIPETFMIGTETFTVEGIDDGAFHNSYIYSITIPKTITSIDDGAFSGCSQLESVKSYIQNPQDCHVHESSFSNIPSNVTLYVPAGTKSAYEAIPEWNVFACIVEMNEELQDDDIFIAKTIEGVEMTFKVTSTVDKTCQVGTGTNGDYLAVHDNTSGKITIPEVANGFTVTSIGDFAFGDGKGSINLPYITEIIIPNTVTYIGRYSFYDMKALESVTLPTSLTTIPDGAFDGCIALTSIVIPNGTTTIGNGAFEGCGLTDLTIPQSVTSIAWGAFADCNALTSVTVNWEEPIDIDDNCFTNAANATLYVPAGTKAAYEAATGWKEFGKIVDPDADTDISELDNVLYVESKNIFADGLNPIQVKMKNSIEIAAIEFILELPDGMTYDSAVLLPDRVTSRSDFSAPVVTPISDKKVHIMVYPSDYNNVKTFKGNDGSILRIKIETSKDIPIGDYPLILRDVKISDKDGETLTHSYIKSTLSIVDGVLGDANNNDDVEIGDIMAIINYMSKHPSSRFQKDKADVNGDSDVDISDIMGVVNTIVRRIKRQNAEVKLNNNEPQ